jgi:selenocysteine lyase/cysteine desulfurase
VSDAIVHLDHATTSLPRLPAAISAAVAAAEMPSPHRGLGSGAIASADLVTVARRRISTLVKGTWTCSFTSGATASLNIAIAGLARARDGIVAVDPLAHNAASRAVAKHAAETWVLPSNEHGVVDVARVIREWPSGVSLVVLTHGSNVTGSVQPVAAIAEVARRHGARVVVDAAQTAGVSGPLDLGDVDAVAFSGHKALAALPGSGVLLVRDASSFEPLLVGGTGFDAEGDAMPARGPERLEAGTPNLPAIAAMSAAVEHALASPLDVAGATAALREAIEGAGACVVGQPEIPVVSFLVEGREPREVEEMLDRVWNVRVRAGLHCAPRAHATVGSKSTVRASSGRSTTASDLLLLRTALEELAQR